MPAAWKGIGVALAAMLFIPSALLAQCPGQPIQKSYPVGDLVVPLQRAAAVSDADPTAEPDTSMGVRFVQLITSTIEPKSWKDAGGVGVIEFVPTTKMLIVSQTPAVHEQVARLLADLRQSQDVLVEVDVRLLTLNEGFFERVGVDFNMEVLYPETKKSGHFAEERINAEMENIRQAQLRLQKILNPHESARDALEKVFIDDTEVKLLLEASQGDRRTSVLQAPRLTLLNGQTGTVRVGETQFFLKSADTGVRGGSSTYKIQNQPYELGFRFTAQPVVSPDRRLVHLYFKLEEKQLAAPESRPTTDKHAPIGQPPGITAHELEKTLAIPLGQTAVMLGNRRVVEYREEYGPRLLSRIPYLNRCFKNVGYGRDAMMEYVLIKPRLVPLSGAPAAGEENVRRGYEQMEKLCPGSRLGSMAGADGKSKDATDKALLHELEPASRQRFDVVAVLQKAFLQAQADGRKEEAERLARALLAIDPTIKLNR